MSANLQDLQALRERLVAATGPDESLDNAILATLLGLTWLEEPRGIRRGVLRWHDGSRTMVDLVPKFTGDVGAAMELTPERWAGAWSVGIGWPAIDGRPWASYGGNRFSAASHALALCLARVEYEIANHGRPDGAGSYLIWSNTHGAWWRPKSAGYTSDLAAAGRYTRDEAIDICAHCRDGYTFRPTPTEIPVREDAALRSDCRHPGDLVLPEDDAECRARDLSRKPAARGA